MKDSNRYPIQKSWQKTLRKLVMQNALLSQEQFEKHITIPLQKNNRAINDHQNI